MSLDPRIILRNSICGLLLCAPTLADEYGPQTFAVPDGTTNLGDGTTIAGNDGVASIQNGALQLTRAGTGDTSSSFRISPLGNSRRGGRPPLSSSSLTIPVAQIPPTASPSITDPSPHTTHHNLRRALRMLMAVERRDGTHRSRTSPLRSTAGTTEVVRTD